VIERESDSELVRKAHIAHEASVKSIGLLYWLGGVVIFIGGLVNLFDGHAKPVDMAIGAALLLLAVVQIWVGTGLRKLNKTARIVTGVFSGIGLLGFPLGTVINGYILYLLFGKKGVVVFSDPYKEVIAATPLIKYKTSVVVWILLGLVALFILLIAVGAFVASMKAK